MINIVTCFNDIFLKCALSCCLLTSFCTKMSVAYRCTWFENPGGKGCVSIMDRPMMFIAVFLLHFYQQVFLIISCGGGILFYPLLTPITPLCTSLSVLFFAEIASNYKRRKTSNNHVYKSIKIH